jgi:subtilisin family serine protease
MFADDFESAENKWLTGGEHENWSTIYDTTFNSTVVVDSIGNYHENEFSYILTADPISAANFRGLNLRFSIRYALERQYDFLKIELSEGETREYETINTITGFSAGIERLVIWSNDTAFDDFYLRFSLSSDENTNFDGVYLDDISLTGIEWVFSGDEYGFKSGTSMAAPVVAGVAGLVWSARPDLTCAQVKEILMNSADPVSSLAGKVISGGRINARSAVLSAIGGVPAGPPSDSEPESESPGSGGDSGCFIGAALSPKCDGKSATHSQSRENG